MLLINTSVFSGGFSLHAHFAYDFGCGCRSARPYLCLLQFESTSVFI